MSARAGACYRVTEPYSLSVNKKVGAAIDYNRARARGRRSFDAAGLVEWAWINERVEKIIGGGVGLFDVERTADGYEPSNASGDGCFQVMRQGILGCRVDVIGYKVGAVHPAAIAVYRLVAEGMPTKIGEPVARYARSASRPDPSEIEEPRLGPCWKGAPHYMANGRPDPRRVLVERSSAWGHVCPLRYDVDPALVRAAWLDLIRWCEGIRTVDDWFRMRPGEIEGVDLLPLPPLPDAAAPADLVPTALGVL